MTNLKTIAAASAALSVIATPVAAAEVPVPSQRSAYAAPAYDAEQDNAERHRRYRGWRRNRVDAGDVIAGIAIIGGIAAIASAASNNNRRDRARTDDRRYRDRDYQRRYSSNNLDRAVSACMREIERDVRVDGVDSVSRVGEGWQVSGRLYNGDGFTCAVGGNGRIDRIDYGAAGYSGADASGAAPSADSQWSDDTYAQARLNSGVTDPRPSVPTEPTGPQPSYPGGPVDGDLGG